MKIGLRDGAGNRPWVVCLIFLVTPRRYDETILPTYGTLRSSQFRLGYTPHSDAEVHRPMSTEKRTIN